MIKVYDDAKTRAQDFRKKYERFFPAVFFICGLIFELLTTGRIDEWLTLIQQFVYLLIIGGLLILEVIETRGPFQLHGFMGKVWKYREEITHFFFATLLSKFIIFYFKSGSLVNSFLFMFVIVALLFLNEMERFKGLGFPIRFALYSLCLVSYFAFLIPILLGFVGMLPFFAAIALSLLVITGVYRILQNKNIDRILLRNKMWAPSLAVQAIFLLLYMFQLIPPVPLSLKEIGIYHKAEKQNGQYVLSYVRPWWKFWQSGAQSFLARPGDRIYVFVQVFSPTGFKDQVKVRWLYHEKKGWHASDAIPLDISGGREEGFRGVAFKENYQPGSWRVQVESADGREIGRLGFDVSNDESNEPREFQIDHH